MRRIHLFALLLTFAASDAIAADRAVRPGEVGAAVRACANKDVIADIMAHPGRHTPFRDRPLSVGEAKWLMLVKAVLAYKFQDESIEELLEVEISRAGPEPGPAEIYGVCIFTARLAQVEKKPAQRLKPARKPD